MRSVFAGRVLSAAALCTALLAPASHAQPSGFRPPAVPLVTFNPFLSIWSKADRLTDKQTSHWTGRVQPLTGLIKVDEALYRVMGSEPAAVDALPQSSLETTPTRSIYRFTNGKVEVSLTFLSPAIPSDLSVLSLPLNYITWSVRSADGVPHRVTIFESIGGGLAVNEPKETVEARAEAVPGLTALRVGTVAQPVLGSAGDSHTADWGYAYLAAPSAGVTSAIGAPAALADQFAASGKLGAEPAASGPTDSSVACALAFDLGTVTGTATERHSMVAYDEIYAIKYFGQKLRPYWRRNGTTAAKMLASADSLYPSLVTRTAQFDRDLVADMTRIGGAEYATVTSLAYREALAACGLAADAKGQPLFFTKENTSNGDIATVDVFFPMDPIWVLLSPALAKASLVGILDYAASPRWRFPNAPHDLGTYPIARGTDDGGEGMPVEESGNMLILIDAIAQAEGNASFAGHWWPKLTQWATYLEKYGLDPEDQLCPDDFMGHLAHNANLSVKAILALAAYGDLCRMRGDAAAADRFMKEARTDALHWVEATRDGDHSRLAFDKPNTWSQKYNLVWDRILGLNVFPPTVASSEVAFYKSMLQPYGLPLDSRTKGTKTDWTFWSATLATSQSDFEALTHPAYTYFNETGAREPLADQYNTDDVNSVGMHARPVMGGLFIKMLSDRAAWRKWASADREKVGPWAPLPKKPTIKVVVPTSAEAAVDWKYTTTDPGAGWMNVDFNDASWKSAPAPFGTERGWHTRWTTPDIWVRREFTLPSSRWKNLQFNMFHDEDIDVYVDGKFASHEAGFNTGYDVSDIYPEARLLLKPGARVMIAAHVHQTVGGQMVDIGLADIVR